MGTLMGNTRSECECVVQLNNCWHMHLIYVYLFHNVKHSINKIRNEQGSGSRVHFSFSLFLRKDNIQRLIAKKWGNKVANTFFLFMGCNIIYIFIHSLFAFLYHVFFSQHLRSGLLKIRHARKTGAKKRIFSSVVSFCSGKGGMSCWRKSYPHTNKCTYTRAHTHAHSNIQNTFD